MSLFCKHEWVLLSEFLTSSRAERAKELIDMHLEVLDFRQELFELRRRMRDEKR